jgi:hypothetical protein
VNTEPTTPAAAYLQIYSVLDTVCFEGAAKPSAHATIHAAIDELRRRGAPAEHVTAAEKIAVALHKLAWAFPKQVAADVEAARAELQEKGAEWLRMPIVAH